MPGVVVGTEKPGPGEYRWTMYVRYPGDTIEEIDVNAVTKTEARRIGMDELEASYQRNWIEFWVEGPRVGFYL